MSKKNFENLLNKYKNESEQEKFDWKARKTEWLNFIKIFYDSVESWLMPYQKENKLSFNYQKISLNEEHIGTYETNAMIIDFAGQQVRLEPIGTVLIGTKGRIDMEGSRGRVQFILADKDSKGMKINVTISVDSEPPKNENKKLTWKIVLRESRRIAYEEFNEDNFFDALMEVVNG